jgi:two-component system nitrogen regulation sensor histidine kinase NtrY
VKLPDFSALYKRLRRSRRLVAVVSLTVLSLLAAIITFFAAGSRRAASGLGVSWPLMVLVIFVELELFIVALVILGRNVIRLFIERTRGVPGSKFRTKMIILIFGIVLIPVTLLSITASGIIGQSVDRWFSAPVETIVKETEKFYDEFLQYVNEKTRLQAERAGALVRADRLYTRSRRPLLEKEMSDILEKGDLDYLDVYIQDTRVLTLRSPEWKADYGKILEAQESVQKKEPPETGVHQIANLGDRLLIRSSVPVLGAYPEGKPIGSVLAGVLVSTALSGSAKTIWNQYERYEQTKLSKEDIKLAYVLLLGFFTIIILFSSIWIGQTIAKGITVPIQKLAEWTREISHGNLEHRTDIEAHDELGILVQSFNSMVDELQQNREQIEASHKNLQETNVELEERRSYIETILQNIPTGVISMNTSGRITNINRSALKMLEIDERENPVGSHFRELFGSKEFLELRVLMEKMMVLRDVSFLRELQIRLGSKVLTLAVNFTALKDSRNERVGTIVVMEDLTEFMRMQKIAAWREMARRMAHEIKNPLTPIKLSAQRILRRGQQASEEDAQIVTTCCESIIQEVDGLKSLVNEFSQFARLPEVHPVPQDLHSILRSAVSLYEGTVDTVRFETTLSDRLPLMKLDPEQMKRVFINLIDNAIEAMQGKGTVYLKTRYDDLAKAVRVEVADEGPGIPPELRDKLFLPYYSTKKGGTGLGLAIVNRIVSDHHGYIRLEDRIPTGARFLIELPV